WPTGYRKRVEMPVGTDERDVDVELVPTRDVDQGAVIRDRKLGAPVPALHPHPVHDRRGFSQAAPRRAVERHRGEHAVARSIQQVTGPEVLRTLAEEEIRLTHGIERQHAAAGDGELR